MSALACVAFIVGSGLFGFLLGSLLGMTVNRWRWRRSSGRHHGRFMRGH